MGIDSAYLDTPGIRSLVERNCRVIIFDQRGHGQSDKSDDVSYTHVTWINDARSLAKHLRLGKFVLLGHSYGGFPALDSRFDCSTNFVRAQLATVQDASASRERY